MKTTLYLVILFILMLVLFSDCKKDKEIIQCTQNIYFPDTNLKNKLLEYYFQYDDGYAFLDANKDGEICDGEAERLHELDISYCGITDLTGLEHFTNLTRLFCNNDSLSILSLTNSKLTYLNCGDNNIDSINLVNLPDLTELWCYGNNLENIDISNNFKLEVVTCFLNNLDTLIVSNNTNLDFLDIENNNISGINLSNNPNLVHFSCKENPLISINLSNNLNLKVVGFGNNNFSKLDLSKNTKLAFLRIDGLSPISEICVWTLPFPPSDQVKVVGIDDYSIFKICE